MGIKRRMHFIKLTAQSAFMPEAARTVQRAIVCRFGNRLKESHDWWAVLLDRKTMVARYRRDRRLPDEGYLHVLIQGYRGAVAIEQQDTLLLQEALRCRALELVGEYRTLQDGLPRLLRDHEEAADRPTGDEGPTTAGECYESPEVIARRRRRERARALRDIETTANATRRRLAEIRAEHAELEDTFRFHQDALLCRAQVVQSYYRTRMHDFARRTLRSCLREGEPPILPEIPLDIAEPSPFPSLPDPAPGERSDTDTSPETRH
ncbi:hypothetical protein JS528_11315 [Bifidobacterium sp. MA2]|uniref:Uncharacterized protein n=1 Tax=Bifidobacterium santillanense TaxID=2809028 RepID=A0ABS5USW6_9BIFI|nr:hypothetical protein [Bifidobacterium santillanense]MBT1173906.1 hypothetical protein [Bifidobacterium santillanense]